MHARARLSVKPAQKINGNAMNHPAVGISSVTRQLNHAKNTRNVRKQPKIHLLVQTSDDGLNLAMEVFFKL
jgi:hypothetical protein